MSVSPALAQREPVIVVPGRPGAPVYINGIDASWGVVEGEFGLDRPGLVAPTVTYRPLVIALPHEVPGYYPAVGRRPGYGRLEIVPPPDRRLPPPAPTYYRSWSSESAPGHVNEYSSEPYSSPATRYQYQSGSTSGHDSNESSESAPAPASGYPLSHAPHVTVSPKVRWPYRPGASHKGS